MCASGHYKIIECSRGILGHVIRDTFSQLVYTENGKGTCKRTKLTPLHHIHVKYFRNVFAKRARTMTIKTFKYVMFLMLPRAATVDKIFVKSIFSWCIIDPYLIFASEDSGRCFVFL